MNPSGETVRGSDVLGIAPGREIELSYYGGRIMYEIYLEEGAAISRNHIARAVLASPHLRDDVERVYIAAALCEALPTGKYELLLRSFLRLTETEFRGLTIEEQLEVWVAGINSSEAVRP